MRHLLLPRRCIIRYSVEERVKKYHLSSICGNISSAHRSYCCSTDDDNNNVTNHSAYVRSALSAGPVPYEKGWAWQHVLLNRRMKYMRMRETHGKSSEGNNYVEQDKDWILMFEHQPVYTLGRGATEDYLTFLKQF